MIIFVPWLAKYVAIDKPMPSLPPVMHAQTIGSDLFLLKMHFKI